MTKRVCAFLIVLLLAGGLLFAGGGTEGAKSEKKTKSIAYLSASTADHFWVWMKNGIEEKCQEFGYEFTVYDGKEEASVQLKNAQNAIVRQVDGLIISPTDSASCPAVLKEAEEAGIPVVIADIGTESGKYLSYVSTPNEEGAYQVGKILADYIVKHNLPKGPVGEIAIPLTRINGRLRQAGFKRAMDEAGIKMGTTLQIRQFTMEESGNFTQNLITGAPNMVALWAHTMFTANGAVKVLEQMGLIGKVIIAGFDGDAAVIQNIKDGKILVACAQQPVEMGRQAAIALKTYFDGGVPPKDIPVPTLLLTADNIKETEPLAKKNVYLD
jgi:ABC-type sugar transport system substrate-binding protein